MLTICTAWWGEKSFSTIDECEDHVSVRWTISFLHNAQTMVWMAAICLHIYSLLFTMELLLLLHHPWVINFSYIGGALAVHAVATLVMWFFFWVTYWVHEILLVKQTCEMVRGWLNFTLHSFFSCKLICLTISLNLNYALFTIVCTDYSSWIVLTQGSFI